MSGASTASSRESLPDCRCILKQQRDAWSAPPYGNCRLLYEPEEAVASRLKGHKEALELVEVNDGHIQRNSGPLGRGKLLADQIQSISSLPLADLALNGIMSSLVIKKQRLLLGQQLWIALGGAEARTTRANAMTLAEGSIGSRSVNLISTDHLGIMTMATPEGSCLSL